MKKIQLFIILFSLFVLALPTMATTEPLPVPNQITLIDLGAHKCIPCKMMAPILKKLTADYENEARIIFIDVWENPDHAKRFKISSIPTQIFFDAQGKEVYRHQGFMDEDAIVTQLRKMGATRPSESK